MSDAWEEIQAIKSKRNSLRERLEKRKKERQDILGSNLGATTSSPVNCLENSNSGLGSPLSVSKEDNKSKTETLGTEELVKVDPELEKELLKTLNEVTLQIPITSTDLVNILKTSLDRHISHGAVCNLLQKFDTQKLLNIKDVLKDGKSIVEVIFVEHIKLNAVVNEAAGEIKAVSDKEESLKRKREESPDNKDEDEEEKKRKKDTKATDIFVSHMLQITFIIFESFCKLNITNLKCFKRKQT